MKKSIKSNKTERIRFTITTRKKPLDNETLLKFARLFHGLKGTNSNYTRTEFKIDLEKLGYSNKEINRLMEPDTITQIHKMQWELFKIENQYFQFP